MNLLLLTSLVVVLFASVIMYNPVKAPVTADIFLDPETSSAAPGSEFTVEVKVTDAADVYGFGFEVNWTGSILDAVSVLEGEFLNQSSTKRSLFVAKWFNEGSPDPVGQANYLTVGDTLLGEPAGAAASGSGTLVTIKFRVQEKGETSISLRVSPGMTLMLLDYYARQTIPHTVESGLFIYPLPKLWVNPEFVFGSQYSVGSSFSVDVNVTSVVDLYSFEFLLNYNTTILSATEVNIVPFLAEPITNASEINDAQGFVMLNVTSHAPALPSSGNGTLANVKFSVASTGSSDLHFSNTTLLHVSGVEIGHGTSDGLFSNVRLSSIVSISLSASSIKLADSVTINGAITPKRSNVDMTVQHRTLGSQEWINLTSLGVVKTSSEGEYTFTWTPGSAGKYEIRVNWGGDEATLPAVSPVKALTVEGPAGTDWFLYAGIAAVVVVVVAVIAVYFLKFRKPKKE